MCRHVRRVGNTLGFGTHSVDLTPTRAFFVFEICYVGRRLVTLLPNLHPASRTIPSQLQNNRDPFEIVNLQKFEKVVTCLPSQLQLDAFGRCDQRTI